MLCVRVEPALPGSGWVDKCSLADYATEMEIISQQKQRVRERFGIVQLLIHEEEQSLMDLITYLNKA